MKKLLFFILFLSTLSLKAQLDTEHWFAPVAAKTNTGATQSFLYLSTNETTPFAVQVFNNNIVFATVQLSKGNPQQVAVPSNMMLAVGQTNLFTPNSMGLYVKGLKKFFANYRVSMTSHAEIITSKGAAGLGKNFYAAMAPLTGTGAAINSTIGVIATEDNTSVVISNYNPGVIFSNNTSPANFTVTLNKGQSYIIDAVSSTNPANTSGLIGTKIEANKAISVTNGNFNGIYTNQNFQNNDILLDQSVPLERLGKDFVVVKGNGTVFSEMETAMILATEDNTTFSINGVNAGITLNTGQYYLVPSSDYILHGIDHYNLSIATNKKVYVYQFLAGTSVGNEYATGGMNFIPPLSCFMPNKIDEIGFINTIGTGIYDTKLNIITQSGAAVTVNNNPLPNTSGPYPVTGNPNWVSYSVQNVTGNITVNSTKSVTAGIAAGSGAVGFGGYFSGFSSVPVITKTGDCYFGLLLQVDNSYDSYQWFLNSVAIPGATSFSINPELYGPGVYTCLITKNNCESKLTDPYTYTSCPPIVNTTYNLGLCNTKVVTPAFTNSTQTIVNSNTSIIVPPQFGTAVINPSTGQITYTPNATLTADTTDTFVYYIQGNGNPFDYEYFRVTINIDVIIVTNATLTVCANANGNGIFNLPNASVTTESGATVTYFTDAGLTNQITVPTNFSSGTAIVYAKVTSQYGCSKTAQIALTVNPAPNINTANFNGNICDDNLDGTINVDFSTVTPQIVTNSVNFIVKYYLTAADAASGTATPLPQNWSYTANTTVYVRVESTNGCPPALGQINFTVGPKIPLLTLDYNTLVCDTNWDGTESVNLNIYKNNFTADPSVTLTFYTTLANAQNAVGAINATQTITPSQIFYVRFQSANGCPSVAKLTLNLDQLSSSNATLTSCSNANGSATFNLTSVIVTTTAGATVAYFSDAALTLPISAPNTYSSSGGNVYAQVTSAFGCTKTAQITLVVNPLPNINTTNFNGAICDDNFDGIINVNFNNVTSQIVTNSANFTVKYYLTAAAAAAGGTNNLPSNWTYTTNTTVFVRVESANGCPPAFGQINFTVGTKIPLLISELNTDVCDLDLNGSEAVNLNNYKNQFTLDTSVTLTFYTTLANAQNATGAVAANQVINNTGTFFIRFESPTSCPNTGKITVTLKRGKKSDVLKDQRVCDGQKAILDAGSGFSAYLWNTGATTPSITAEPGNYYVDLTFNGCVYRQNVTVTVSPTPVISSIQISGSNATINVSGGTPPYQYSLNGIDYQTSNIFTGLIRGPKTVYVISADGCAPVKKDFLMINLLNAITPNGDGYNDKLDYTDLNIKNNVSIEIVDRYGAMIYKSSEKNYVWDGKLGGRNLSTGTYWYLIKWIEPDTKLPVSYSGWLLIKNRE
ncbi:hypothetical protein ASG01_08415 [Chryseobacterium sp. Leaf180]|uniref:T9SS type B sorting domain-containing protein n=1 Tax=Chryseobacterium sp. Leaf180 TaxID=1736289 RepID=UPI0006F4921C|nr:T9SS type B sorting domain-containing protein [Chryseobacterium sp. Leaf180]KQR93872.1 hypothetical protein ASG01_08415 [Chryseobacterium sp. Leaf180]